MNVAKSYLIQVFVTIDSKRNKTRTRGNENKPVLSLLGQSCASSPLLERNTKSMPRNNVIRNQRPSGLKSNKARQGGGITATQFMLMTVLIAMFFILVNVYHLMPASGLDEPLNPQRTAVGAEAKEGSTTQTSLSNQQQQPEQPQQGNALQGQGNEGVKYHTIFSTGCSPKQNFQSYIFFFHAMKSGQPGQVTRIASCKDFTEKESVLAWHKEFVEPMSPNFHTHTTPDYSGVKPGFSFYYFNKPFSTHHWMENALGYNPQHKNVGDNINDDTIIILCDPDQIIMRPFTNNLFDHKTELWAPRTTHPIWDKVEHGKPMAAMYGFYLQWKQKTNITRYVPANELPSFVQTMSEAEANENYAVGPPYIATAKDFYQIVQRWKDFVPLIHDDYPYLLAGKA